MVYIIWRSIPIIEYIYRVYVYVCVGDPFYMVLLVYLQSISYIELPTERVEKGINKRRETNCTALYMYMYIPTLVDVHMYVEGKW